MADSEQEQEQNQQIQIPIDSAQISASDLPNEHGLLPEELVEVPTFMNTPCCDSQLIEEARELLRQRVRERPDNFYQSDLDRILGDDWTTSRFLLRCRLDPKRSVDLMEAAGKFRREFKMGELQPEDFPYEMHEIGACFKYAPDRVGNTTLWMRVRYHRRSSEMSMIIKQFILCIMEQCDRASNGRGVAVIFDLTECGIKNADPSFLFWLLSAFRNYCPKGLSYILVYNLPWVMNATCQIAMSWMSATNKRRLRFIEGDQIQKFIAPENLPDFVPGGKSTLSYRAVPKHSKLVEAQPEHKLLPISENLALKIRETHRKMTTCSEN